MKEKVFSIKISEKELANPKIKDGLVNLVNLRLKYQKGKPYAMLSSVECAIIKKHNSWTDVKLYKAKKDRYNGEVGKYLGRRICIRGKK